MSDAQSAQIELLYRENFHALVVHAYRFLGSWETATEAAQEAFRIACEKPDDLLNSANSVGWLMNTTRFVSLNIAKRRKTYAKLLTSLAVLNQKEARREPRQPYDELDEVCGITDRESLELLDQIFLKGRSYRAVAAEHQISVWACYKRVQRILEKIKNNF